jgi:hypothetical protein
MSSPGYDTGDDMALEKKKDIRLTALASAAG